MFGSKIDVILVNGGIIKCRVKVVSSGSMAKLTKVITLMIKNMDLALLLGLMVACTVASGRMASRTVKDNITYLMGPKKLEYGLTENELDGFKIIKYELFF
jgi:hypothetical protein